MIDAKTEQTAPQTAVAPMPKPEQFNWRHVWYPVAFVQDLPKERLYSFSLYDEPLVLFRDQNRQIRCLTDRCSHRAAKLSDGRIVDGKVECLYHGWQFGVNGECLHIPQLPTDVKIPAQACVRSFLTVERQGIVWVWLGEPEAADVEDIPTLAALDKPGFVHTDCMLDLPYDQTYLVENVMDPAHVSISHDGTRGGGKRQNAQPLEMEVIESSEKKIRGRWRGARNPNETWKYIDFVAPNLVLNSADVAERGWSFGLALYSIPLGKGRCRLLARGYRNFFTWGVKLRPRWLEHLNTNKILEQDLPLIVGQQKQIEQLGQSLKKVYLPLKTSDQFVVEYRKWLDQVGPFLPFYEGYSTYQRASVGESGNVPMLRDRYSRHTSICSSCNRTAQVLNRIRQALVVIAIGMAGMAMVIDGSLNQKLVAVFALLSAAVAAVVQEFKTRFERSYQRP